MLYFLHSDKVVYCTRRIILKMILCIFKLSFLLLFQGFQGFKNKTTNFQGFQGRVVRFQGFQEFQGFQGPADTLLYSIIIKM